MVNIYLWGARDTSVDGRGAFMVHLNSIQGASVKHAWGIPGAPMVFSKCICGAPVRHSWRIRSRCEWIRGAPVVLSNSIRCASNAHPWCFHCTSTVHLWCTCGASFVHWSRIFCALVLHYKHLKSVKKNCFTRKVIRLKIQQEITYFIIRIVDISISQPSKVTSILTQYCIHINVYIIQRASGWQLLNTHITSHYEPCTHCFYPPFVFPNVHTARIIDKKMIRKIDKKNW